MPRKLDKSIGSLSGIYCIENLTNNKKNVGKATNLRNRLLYHKSRLRRNKDQSCYLQNAWNKTGEDNFSFYILEYCDNDILNEREKYWIDYLKTFYKEGFGYNLTKGGEGLNGFSHSEATKNKISKSKKNPSNEVREKHSKANRGIKRNIICTSNHVGVSYEKKNNRWKAQIEHSGKKFWLGRFADEKAAALAYNSKASEIYGNEAVLNRIGDYNQCPGAHSEKK